MKTALIAFCLSLVAFEAHAILRYNSTAMSCGEVKATVREEGAVILRWRSTRNPSLQLYGRFVAHEGFCSLGERAETSFVPSSDRTSCGVFECKQRTFDDEDFFLWRRRHH